MQPRRRAGRMLRGALLACLALPSPACGPAPPWARLPPGAPAVQSDPRDLAPMPELSDAEYRRTRTTGEEFEPEEVLAEVFPAPRKRDTTGGYVSTAAVFSPAQSPSSVFPTM